MGFFDKFVTTYSQGYQQKRAESRVQEDSERDVRLKMYQAALADDTLTDDERHHILNQMGEDTGYKHDPKVFGLFAPPGHIAHHNTDRPGGALVRQSDSTWRWQTQAAAGQLPPPPSEFGQGQGPTQYPPGYAPDKSSRAGRKEAWQVREAWAQVQGQAELMKRRGFTEKMDSVIDADTGELVQTFFNPATGRNRRRRGRKSIAGRRGRGREVLPEARTRAEVLRLFAGRGAGRRRVTVREVRLAGRRRLRRDALAGRYWARDAGGGRGEDRLSAEPVLLAAVVSCCIGTMWKGRALTQSPAPLFLVGPVSRTRAFRAN
jgi:hypothetical protein